MSDEETTPTSDRTFTFERVVDAPRELVFRLWTEPDHVAEWWGPAGFDTPRENVEIDLRPGGIFSAPMVLRDADIAAEIGVEVGTEFPDRSEIAELSPPELLVLASAAQPELGVPVATSSRIEFAEEADGKTRITVTSGPYTEEMAGHAETGFKQQLEKLERLLASRA